MLNIRTYNSSTPLLSLINRQLTVSASSESLKQMVTKLWKHPLIFEQLQVNVKGISQHIQMEIQRYAAKRLAVVISACYQS